MGGTRALTGVVENFLSTYVSRYSAYDGYWLFAFLVPELTTIHSDLLGPSSEARPPFRHAIDLARARFDDQVRKARVDIGLLGRVDLGLSRAEQAVPIGINGHHADGWPVTVSIDVEVLSGKHHKAERVIVVARHNPSVEFRSNVVIRIP